MISNSTPLAKGASVLVTGGTGFLGAYILEDLVGQGYRVKALRRQSSSLPFFIDASILDQVEWVEGDVLDLVSLEDAMVDVDAVVHSAAVVSFSSQDRTKMYQVNVEGTANVVNMALEMDIKRFVHISSVAALGRTSQGELVTEAKEWKESKVNTHYAISKHKAEMEVWRAFAEGLPGVILNPSTILGFGDWRQSSCAIFKNVYQEFPWYTTGLNGFVYVRDVARATSSMLNSSYAMERYIVSGDNWPFKQLLDTMADGLRKKRPSRQATPMLAELAWRAEKIKSLFTGDKPLLSRESAKVAHSKTRFDNAKLLQALPDFEYTPLERAIEISCQAYLKKHG